MRILRARDFAAQPWKNGLGVSQVIAAHPPGAEHDALHWQVSTTGIAAACPFSSRPGVDRQFMLLEGEGVELHCLGANGRPDFRQSIHSKFDPFAFRGDWQTQCRLLGTAVRVFNVMTRRERCSARVSVSTMRGATTLEKSADETLLAFVAEGAIGIDGHPEVLAADDALVADERTPGRYAVRSESARVVIVRLSPVHAGAGH